MIVVTTDAIPGKRVVEVLGVVTGEGRWSYETPWSLVERATPPMVAEAERMGANAIVGVGYTIGGNESGMFVIAYGTAVVVDDAG